MYIYTTYLRSLTLNIKKKKKNSKGKKNSFNIQNLLLTSFL